MNQLIIFYLMTSATQVIPLVIITLILHYERPMQCIPKMPGDRSLPHHEFGKIGIARFNQLFKYFDEDARNYFARFSLVACVVQLITTFLIIVAIILELPFPLIPHIDETLIMDVMHDLLMFSTTNAFLHLCPKIILDLIYFYGVPIPFMPKPPKIRGPLDTEIRHLAEDSEDFASIRLTRFENGEKIYFYVYCRDDRSGEVFKVVLCQGKEAGAKPQCFTYTDYDESTLKQINPAPVSVNVLDEIFISGVIEVFTVTMLQLFTFYSVTSGSQVVPLFVVFTILMFGIPTVIFPKMPHDSPPLKRGLRRIGITRYKQIFIIFISHIKEYLAIFSVVAFSLQFIIIATVFFALIVDYYFYLLPFTFIPYLEGRWTPAVVYDLFLFWVTTGFIQWLPMICLVLALLSRIPLPLMSTLTEIQTPPSDEIVDGEENSEGFAWIHLTRYENAEKIIIYVYCRDDRSQEIFKAILCQEKEGDAGPQCFLLTEDGYLEQIIPCPVTFDVLDEIFTPDENEVTV